MSAYALVAQNQVHLFRGWHIVYLQLVSISSQLNQRCDLGFASELRVRDGIFTSVGELQEVCETLKHPIKECCLKNNLLLIGQRLKGLCR